MTCLVMTLAAILFKDDLTAVRATTKPENSKPRLRSSFQWIFLVSGSYTVICSGAKPNRALISGIKNDNMPTSITTSKKGTGTTAAPAET